MNTMKWLKALATILTGLLSIGVARTFFEKYEFLVVNKNNTGEFEEPTALDLRGTPTHTCTCGSQTWYVKTVFENYEIATYFLDMLCSECGNLATAPTPVDREKME
jgi:hypothetical protein